MKPIIVPGRNAKEWVRSEDSGLLIDGEDYYQAFVDACLSAQHTILLSGWQFDSDAHLLRGERAIATPKYPKTLLRFLEYLCRTKEDLSIYILAWDFNLFFAMEREWMQELIFHWSTHERMHFHFDGKHTVGASQHRKYVVVDGRWAFLGGMDICESRWDRRAHAAEDPQRATHLEEPYQPYHDIQCSLSGEAARYLQREFQERWKCVTSKDLELPEPLPVDRPAPFKPTLKLPAGPMAFSRTQGACAEPETREILEIRTLYGDAIEAAERVIYLENQYFTSESVFRALMRRLCAKRSLLQIAVILPRNPEQPKERIALGVRQSRLLKRLMQEAEAHGHKMGVYFTGNSLNNGDIVPAYIHSKLIVVDDRFVTLGSANTTNRSLGLDSEINASWESTTAGDPLIGAIRGVRVDLLAEHSGADPKELERIEGLVERLDKLTQRPDARLHKHPLDNLLERSPLLEKVLPADIGWDPDQPLLEENEWEQFWQGESRIVGRALDRVRGWLATPADP